MSNTEKILKSLSSLIENGILTSKDIKKEIRADFFFHALLVFEIFLSKYVICTYNIYNIILYIKYIFVLCYGITLSV